MKNFILVFQILFVAGAGSIAFAESTGGTGGGNLWSRSQAREASRWSLQEWMAQKQKVQMMDMWLSLHSPSPYEFSLRGSYLSYKTTSTLSSITTNESISYSGQLQAYAQMFGLSLEHENNASEKYNDLIGLFNLRLLGNSIQNSNLTLHWELRTRDLNRLNVQSKVPQQFAQASLQLHMTKAFGVQGLYRSYQSYQDVTLGECRGTYSEAGAFIDFAAVRVFGSWYKEESIYKSSQETTDTREGISSGLQFFF